MRANTTGLKLTQLVNQFALNDPKNANKELRSNGNNLYVKKGKALITKVDGRTESRNNAIALVRDSLALELNVSQLEAERLMTDVFCAMPWRITCSDVQRLQQSIPLQQELLQTLDKEVSHLAGDEDLRDLFPDEYLTEQQAIDCVMQGVKLAREVLDGTSTGLLVTPQNHNAFFAKLKVTMEGMQPYESCDQAGKETWLRLGRALPLSCPNAARGLGAGLKASCLDALSSHAMTCSDAPTRTDAFRAIISFNKLFKLSDLHTPSGEAKLESFYVAVGKDQVIENAYNNWGTMDLPERRQAIQKVIELHSQEYGYNVPQNYLQITHDEVPNLRGALSHDGLSLFLNAANSDNFNEFATLFGTVMHESTHKFQHELDKYLLSGAIGPGDPFHDQARIFSANNKADLHEDELNNLGVSDFDSHWGYCRQPIELHAFHVGDDAPARLAQIF